MIDTIPPDTAISAEPATITQLTPAAFAFSGTDNPGGSGVAGYLVSLDGSSFTPATSPDIIPALGVGVHTFAVEAVDAAGNVDPTPASYSWTELAPVGIASIAASVTSGTPLKAGDSVTFTLQASQILRVKPGIGGATPVLTLDDGATATYVSGSGTDALLFTTTIGAGQTDSNLTVTGLEPNGATITGGPVGLGLQAGAIYGAGGDPASITTADLNGDGNPDLVVTNFYGGTVLVSLGNGSGGFGTPSVYDAGFAPTSVTTADVNGDGIPDLVVADEAGGVSVLLGNGSGGFGAPTSYAAGTNPYAVTTADLNGDGIPDLAVANIFGGISVLLGTGGGAFGPATAYAAGTSPHAEGPLPTAITTADVNGDGIPDLIVGEYNAGVAVLLGTGGGAFGPATTYAAGSEPMSVATADFNGDGIPDLVVADQGGGVSVLLGNGSGGFGTATSYAAGSSPRGVATADVNGDGWQDIVVADLGGGISVLLGDGSGGFAPALAYDKGASDDSVTTADLNGDGKPEVLAANYAGGIDVLNNYTPTMGIDLTSVSSATPGSASGIVVDTTAPLVSITPLADTTTEASQVMTGTGEAGTALSLSDNGSAVGAMTVGADGTWSLPVTLAAGSNSLVAADSDAAGNIGTSSPLAIDLIAAASVDPVVSTVPAASSDPTTSDTATLSAPSNQTAAPPRPQVGFDSAVTFEGPNSFTLSGTASDPSGIASVELFATIDGLPTSIGAANIAADGTWTITDNAGPVSQSAIDVVVTDGAGSQITLPANFDLTSGITGEPYKAYQDSYDGAGDFLGQTFFTWNGTILYTDTYAAESDGSVAYTTSGGSYFKAKPYFAYIDTFDAAGVETEEDVYYKDGSQTVQGLVGHQTLHSIANDTFYPTGKDNVFVFTPGFGADVVTSFHVKGAGHDTLDLAASDFSNIAKVLRDTHNQKGSAVIADPVSGDTITLQSVTKAELKSHRQDFQLT